MTIARNQLLRRVIEKVTNEAASSDGAGSDAAVLGLHGHLLGLNTPLLMS